MAMEALTPALSQGERGTGDRLYVERRGGARAYVASDCGDAGCGSISACGRGENWVRNKALAGTGSRVGRSRIGDACGSACVLPIED